MISKRSSEVASRAFQGSFKGVLRKLKWYLKKVSSVFSENFKQSFNSVSKIFNKILFCNFVLFGSHRSYPIRRRACFLKFGQNWVNNK